MRRALLAIASAIAVLVSCVAVFSACGSDDDAAAVVQQSEAGPPDGSPSIDAGAGAETSSTEKHLTAFPCGSTSCLAGEHACCALNGSFACFSLEAGGCPATDAGADADAGPAPSPFLCASYNNCDDDEKCCYVPDAGSSCMEDCPSGAENLCQLGVDGCGEDYDCVTLTPPPLPNTGRCKKD